MLERFGFGAILAYVSITYSLCASGCLATGVGAGRTALRSRTFIAVYSSALVDIDRSDATKVRYGQGAAIRRTPDHQYTYEDDLFCGSFHVASSRINLTITNKSELSIKIVWDEAAFIDIDGQSMRLAHEGTKYADRHAPQLPSVVPAGARASDSILPIDRVFYRQGDYQPSYRNPAGWEELPLIQPALWDIPSYDDNLASLDVYVSEAQKNKGKRFAILLPLQVEESTNEYTFWFEIKDVTIQEIPENLAQ